MEACRLVAAVKVFSFGVRLKVMQEDIAILSGSIMDSHWCG